MEKKAPLLEKLEESIFFFKEKYGFAPDTIALSPALVKALMRLLKREGRLPAKATDEYELLGCEVRHLKGMKTSQPWQFMLEAVRGGQRYQQHGVMHIQELGVTDVKRVIHDGVMDIGYDESVPEAEYLTGGPDGD